MLIPREKPYLQGLNSYDLQLEKFITHLQGEIGSGALHCASRSLGMLIYFNESEIIASVVQKQGAKIAHPTSFEIARNLFYEGSHAVGVQFLDDNAIYFWAQMPPFQWAKSALKSSEIPLPDLIFRLGQKQFSGFIDVQLVGRPENGLLFFHEGKRIGGSYSCGNGGLSRANADYTDLLGRVQSADAAFTFGSFVREKGTVHGGDGARLPEQEETGLTSGDLRLALEEFLSYFVQTMRQKTRIDPVLALKEHFQVKVLNFPFLDPARGFFEYSGGEVFFSSNAPVDKVTRAVITCAWELVRMHNCRDAFAQTLRTMKHLAALNEHRISIDG